MDRTTVNWVEALGWVTTGQRFRSLRGQVVNLDMGPVFRFLSRRLNYTYEYNDWEEEEYLVWSRD